MTDTTKDEALTVALRTLEAVAPLTMGTVEGPGVIEAINTVREALDDDG